MQLITATDLRRNTKKLFDALEQGKDVNLIRGSKVFAIKAKGLSGNEKVFNAKEFGRLIKKLNFSSLSNKEIDKRYRKAMEAKHGKPILRR